MTDAPDQIWWTADEIAAETLPDMPGTKRRVNAMAERLGWRGDTERARRRAGRGGGWEYHWSLFPLAAQKRLLATAQTDRPAVEQKSREDAWRGYEALPGHLKVQAEHRLKVVQMVEAIERGGSTRHLAVEEAARHFEKSARTVWNWLDLIEGVGVADRLAYLVPRPRGPRKNTGQRDASPEWWAFLKGDYLRLEQPSFAACWRRAERVAKKEGWSILPEGTARRRLQAEMSKPSLILARKGVDALKQHYPAQVRDKTQLHALEVVNADYHKFDVFVRFPAPTGSNSGEGEIIRPQMVAFQDIYSGRILAWRLDRNPNKTSVGLCLGDLVEQWGIPEHMVLDNGREFANKFLTGQAATRHRFKVKDDDIPGLLISLGCDVHWATPYSGQSKPIERAFRDMCDNIAKDPRFAGAYTGNRPDAKPENYGSRAIELDRFLEVLAEGIEEHNARTGRRTDTASGRSFIETFDASYASAPIRKATAEQRRLWLMGAEGIQADRRTGLVKFMGNEYWADWMHSVAGDKIVARFDPADLWAGLHVYALTGEYLGEAPCRAKAGFFDVDEGREHARARRAWMRAEKDRLDAIERMRVTDIGAALDEAAPPIPPKPEATVVRPLFEKPVRKDEPTPPEVAERQKALVADLSEVRAARPKPETQEKEEPLQRYKKALDFIARQKAGEPLSRDEQRWLSAYRTSAEFAAHEKLREAYGDEMLG